MHTTAPSEKSCDKIPITLYGSLSQHTPDCTVGLLLSLNGDALLREGRGERVRLPTLTIVDIGVPFCAIRQREYDVFDSP